MKLPHKFTDLRAVPKQVKKLRIKHLHFSYKWVTLLVLISIIASFSGYSIHNQQRQQEATLRASEHDAAEAIADRVAYQKAEELKEQQAAAEKAKQEEQINSTIPTGLKAPRPTSTTKPGDVIDGNTTKNEKIYYAGKLISSVSEVTVSKSFKSALPLITITTPDGVAVGMPSFYWDNGSQPAILGYLGNPADASAFKSSWEMQVGPNYNAVAGQTYTIEYFAHPYTQVGTFEYFGYLTVHIVD